MKPLTSRDEGSSLRPKWNPKHKIFLSHSGKDKEFVRQLCKDLEVETHQPFFDERSSSLIKGERFAFHVLEAAKHCLVAVVVLSKDFLTSKWPMLELLEFVKAKKSHNHELKLFPLFYKLSPDDLKDECINIRWKAAWAKMNTPLDRATTLYDPRVPQAQLNWTFCAEALRELRGSNGLRFENFDSEVAYRETIVKEISLLVPPEVLDDTSNVIGNERLCKVLVGMFVEDTCEESNLQGTCKLGLYGMGGLGKTTMSRALCMFFRRDFNGRVFHVELGSRPPLELQKLVLTKLLRISKDVVERIHTVHEGQKFLRDHMKLQRVFLAIDNVSNDYESQSEALAYIDARFHPGSKIMITSRSFDIVQELFPSHPNATYCVPLTSLNEEEAQVIFLQRAAPQRKLETLTNKEHEIMRLCVGQCCFSFEDGITKYHPMALGALGEYFFKQGDSNVVAWKDHLEDLEKMKISRASSNIFDVLGLHFRILALPTKLLFMDLSLHIGSWEIADKHYGWVVGWLADIHERTPIDVENELQTLKRSGIISITLNKRKEQRINVHDLYKEFAEWYVTDGEGSRLPELGCVYHTKRSDMLPYVLKRTDPSAAYQLQRIHLVGLRCTSFPSKKVQEWCNVVVLQIFWCCNLKVLDLHGLGCLRHLELVDLEDLETIQFSDSSSSNGPYSVGTLESLQHVKLEYLPSLQRIPDFSLCTLLKSVVLRRCSRNLAEPPRLMGCSLLERMEVEWNEQWRMEVFSLISFTSLAFLKLIDYTNYTTIAPWRDAQLAGLEACSQLRSLTLSFLPITRLSGLEKLTKLHELRVTHCDFLRHIPDVSALTQLEFLELSNKKITRIPGVEKLLHLRVLNCRYSEELTILPDLDHLPRLRAVKLRLCYSLEANPRVSPRCRIHL